VFDDFAIRLGEGRHGGGGENQQGGGGNPLHMPNSLAVGPGESSKGVLTLGDPVSSQS
jgi:hypothetical protein